MTLRGWVVRGLAAAGVWVAIHGCDDGFETAGDAVDCFVPDVDELPFDRDAFVEQVSGAHKSTLMWRGPGANALAEDEQTAALVMDVRKTGDLKWGLHCGGYARFPVEVEVSLSGGRRATFQGEARGVKAGTQIWGRATTRVAKALAVPGPAVVGEGQPDYRLYAWIDDDGARGSLSSQSDTAAECERARWPVEQVCLDLSDRQVPFDTTFGDFEFEDIVDDLEQLQSQQLRWQDDESTSEVSLTFAPRRDAPVCVGIEHSDAAPLGYRGSTLQAPFTARVQTADGRVDAEIPVMVSVQWSERRGVMEVPGDGVFEVDHTLRISGSATRSGTELFRPAEDASNDADAFQSLGVYIAAGKDAVQGRVYLSVIHVDSSKPQIELSAAGERMSLDGVCIEGASRHEDVARGVFGMWDRPEAALR